jgi:rsbT antagonist protein RsbS
MAVGVIPILRIGQTLLASIQVELYDTVVDAFQSDILEKIEKTGAQGLIIDISALETVDSYVARMLANTAKMAKLMGTDTVVVGMRPAVAATLVRMGYYMEGIHTALSLEEGLQLQASNRARLADAE